MHESDSVTSARALGVLLSTGAVIWAARVYAYLLAERLQGKQRMHPHDVRRVGTREWPIFQATLPLSLPLALGALGVLEEDAAFSLATVVGVAMLIGWGVVFSHRAGHGTAGLVGAAAVNSLVGLLIVGLELAIPCGEIHNAQLSSSCRLQHADRRLTCLNSLLRFPHSSAASPGRR